MAQSGEKLYQCPVCYKGFSKPHTVKIHLRVHTGEKPFQCQYCPKAFTTSGNLSDHLRVHSTARMFKCKLCGAKFKRKATLKRHYEMHSKYKKSQEIPENSEIVVNGNTEEEILQTEIVNQPIYITGYDRSSNIIVAEHGEETVQTEIVRHPSPLQLEDLQDQHSATIELLFSPVAGREDQESLLVNSFQVKEEKLDEFYDAAILEVTETYEDFSSSGMQLKVCRLPTNSAQASKSPMQHGYSQTEGISVITNPDVLVNATATNSNHLELESMHLDLSRKYGAYVTKMLKLIGPKEKQVELIKELNQAIHEFVIDNR